MGRPGDHPVRDAVLDALTTVGPMSRDELVSFVGASWAGVHKAIEALRSQQVVRIARWDMGRDGIRRKPIAVFSLGSAPDATMRKLTNAEHHRRYRTKRAGIVAARRAANQGVFGHMVEQLRRAG